MRTYDGLVYFEVVFGMVRRHPRAASRLRAIAFTLQVFHLYDPRRSVRFSEDERIPRDVGHLEDDGVGGNEEQLRRQFSRNVPTPAR